MAEKTLPQARCRDCRKNPRNCICVEYRLELNAGGTSNTPFAFVYADNVATEPVRGQEAREWQPRANARVWRSPTYLDGFGPILYITNGEAYEEVREAIKNGTFNLANYRGKEGYRVGNFHKDIVKRFRFLRRSFVSDAERAVA